MLSLITTPSGERLIRSTTRRQAVDHVVKGTITAKTINADELADLLDRGLKIENAETTDPVVEEAANKADTTEGQFGVTDNEGDDNGTE